MLRFTLQAPSVLDNPMQPLTSEEYGLPFRFPVEDAFPPSEYDLSKPESFSVQRLAFMVLGVLPLSFIQWGPEDDVFQQMFAYQANAAAKLHFCLALAIGLLFLMPSVVGASANYRESSGDIIFKWTAFLLWPVVLIIKTAFPLVAGILAPVICGIFVFLFQKHFFQTSSGGLWSPDVWEQSLARGTAPPGIVPASWKKTLVTAWRSWDTYNDRELKSPMLLSSPAGTRWKRLVLAAYASFFLAHCVGCVGWAPPEISSLRLLVPGVAPGINALLLFFPALLLAGLTMLVFSGLLLTVLSDGGFVACAMREEAFAPERFSDFLSSMPWQQHEN